MKFKTDKWIDFDFDADGWSTSHENRNDASIQFARDFKSDVRSMLKGTDWTIDTLKANWFVLSGFLYNKTKDVWVYLSVSDLRHWRNSWTDNMLVRTADSNKDYTGHANNSVGLRGLVDYLKSKE